MKTIGIGLTNDDLMMALHEAQEAYYYLAGAVDCMRGEPATIDTDAYIQGYSERYAYEQQQTARAIND